MCHLCRLVTGPTSRYTRVCDKIQTAIANPHVTNPKNSSEFVDHDNPSGSSDDTLTLHSRNGVNNSSRQSSTVSIEIVDHDNMSPNVGRPSLLRDESSDSDDGLLDT